jgi:hypothetical protein
MNMNVKVDNQNYIIPEQNTFLDIKQFFLREFNLVIKQITINGSIVFDKFEVKAFNGEIIANEDTFAYENYGEHNKYLRCSYCRQTLHFETVKCFHTNKCRSKMSKSKTKISQDWGSSILQEKSNSTILEEFAILDCQIKQTENITGNF